MELRSFDGRSYVSLTTWKVDDYGVKAAIAVQDLGFAGAYDEVWFFRNAFVSFIQALSQFADKHEGEAHLESMSPGEAVLSIRSLDIARHVLVEAQVARWHCIRSHPFLNRVSVAFELDPSLLPDVVRNLAAVIAEAKSL